MGKARWLFGLGAVGLAALWITHTSRPVPEAGDGPVAVERVRVAPSADEPSEGSPEREANGSREELPVREAEGVGLRLSGRVVAAEHGPLAEAEVLVALPRAEESWGTMGFQSSAWCLLAPEARPASEILARTRTDADGRFALEVPASAELHLSVRARGWLGAERWLELAGEEARELEEVLLRPARVLAGRLTDSAGRPLAGARVLGRGYGRIDDEHNLARAGARLAECDEGGNFELSGVGDEELELVHPGFLPRRMRFRELAQACAAGPIALEPAAAIEGRVVGLGAGEVALTYWNQEADETLFVPASAGHEFTLHGLAPGSRVSPSVVYRAASSEEWETVAHARELVAGTRDVELVVPAECVFRARLVDRESGAPVAGGGLGLLEGWIFESERPTRFEELGNGEVQLTVRLPSDSCWSLFAYGPEHAAQALGKLPYRPGEIVELGTLALQAAPALPVRVLDARGAPVQGAVLEARELDQADEYCGNAFMRCEWKVGEEIHPGWKGTSDARGEARFAPCSRLAHVLTVTHPEFVATSTVVEAVGQRPDELVVRLDEGGTLELACVDLVTGLPLAGVDLELEQRDADGEFQRWSSERVDPQGRLSVAHLPAGHWRVRVEDGRWTPLELADGQRLECTLTSAPPGRVSLRGRVTDGGLPVPFARVELWGAETTTDARGTFLLRGLELGRNLLKVSHPEHGPVYESALELERLENVLELELGLREVAGLVLDNSGHSVDAAQVRFGVLGDGGELESITGAACTLDTGADGAFRFDAVPTRPGQGLEVRRAGHEILRVPLAEGPQGGLELRLRPAAIVTVEFELPPGHLMVFGEVVARWRGSEGAAPSPQSGVRLPAEAGRARQLFEHLQPGPWSFEYQDFLAEDETPLRVDVQLAPGPNPPVILGP